MPGLRGRLREKEREVSLQQKIHGGVVVLCLVVWLGIRPLLETIIPMIAALVSGS